MAAAETKVVLTPEQYLELENKKLENELKIEQMKITSAEKIATENNKVAAEANKVGFWNNVINGAKVVGYVILSVIGIFFGWKTFIEVEAFEMQGTLPKTGLGFANKALENANKRIEALK